jgi:hypothetical protein
MRIEINRQFSEKVCMKCYRDLSSKASIGVPPLPRLASSACTDAPAFGREARGIYEA